MGYGVTGLLPRAHVDESNIQGLFAVKEGRMIIFDLAWYEYQTLSSYEVKRLATHGDATEDGITQAADQIKTLPRFVNLPKTFSVSGSWRRLCNLRVRFIREHELIGPRLHDIITHPTEILEHMSGTATSFIGIQQPDCRRDMYARTKPCTCAYNTCKV